MRFFPLLSFFFYCLLCSCATYAQGWSWNWASGCAAGTGGSEGWAVCTDPWGNVFVAGYPNGNSVKFGSVTLTGFGGDAAIVVKYDASGNLVWAHSSQNSYASPIGIAADVSGSVYLLGYYTGPSVTFGSLLLNNPASATDFCLFLTKYSPSGSVEWAKNIVTGSSAIFTGIGCVATNGDDVYITNTFFGAAITVGAYTLTNTDATGATSDILVARLDGLGNIAWAKSAGGVGSDTAAAIAVTPAGNIYVAGTFSSPTIAFGGATLTNAGYPSGSSIFLAKYNNAGSVLWAQGAGGKNEFVGDVATDAAENAFLVGAFCNEALTFGGYTVNDPLGNKDIFLVKYNSAGIAAWANEISGNSNVTGYGVATDACDNVWISGGMGYATGTGIPAITISGNTYNAPAGFLDPMVIAAYTTAGALATCTTLPTGGDDMNGVCTDGVGNVYIGSDFAISPFTLGSSTLTHDSTEENIFVARFGLNRVSDTVSSTLTTCFSDTLVLHAPSGFQSYIWSDGSIDSACAVKSAGAYWVHATGGCNAPVTIDSFNIDDGSNCNCSAALFIPNAFTPNGDGQDDVFYPRCGPGLALVKSFRVYGRWGELIFDRENISPNDKTNAWDGSFKGDEPRSDVYVWVVDIQCDNGNIFQKKGNVTVIK